MKIVLKDGSEYELRRINKLIVDSVETSEYKNYITDKSVTTCEVTLLSLVPTEGVVPDLFKIKTDFSVSYVDHNTLQSGFENADDHAYLRSVADKYGILFSRAGNGICHQVNLERFSRPGKTLLGSDSHTPTCGGAGMLAIGSGGMDVALAMAGEAFSLLMPKIVKIELTGKSGKENENVCN